jgi:MFS family permease
MSKLGATVATRIAAMPALVILLAGQAMASMDASILAVAAPNLRASLHASGAELQLVLAMYTLVFAALVVTGARLGDVLGHRRAFLVGLSGFTLASLAGGLAPTPNVLIMARAAQGGAAAVMTPQVLSIIQVQFQGQARARAVGAYSMILAVGVAAGQVLGGLLVGAHLLAAAWRPALLLNAPVGVALLLAGSRGLPTLASGRWRRLDLGGVATLTIALLALVVPVTLGRDAGWPPWAWGCLLTSGLALAGFAVLERRIARDGGDPLFDLTVLVLPGVAAGVAAVMLVMACYAGFLISLTLHLQDGLGFSPLHAGLTFAVYAAGFGTASLTWSRLRRAVADPMPVLGPLLMASALLALGVIAAGGRWPAALIAPLLFCGGIGHAWAFSPLANRLTSAVRSDQAADLSGLIITANLVGQAVGVATLVGIYLQAARQGTGHGLAVSNAAIVAVLIASALCAMRALPRLAHGATHGSAQRPSPQHRYAGNGGVDTKRS